MTSKKSAKATSAKKVTKVTAEEKVVNQENATNATLFSDKATFEKALTAFKALCSPVKNAKLCAKWNGPVETTVRKAGTRKAGIFRFGSFAGIYSQRFLFIAQHKLNSAASERGSVAVPRVMATCGNELCVNPAHIVERTSGRTQIVTVPKATSAKKNGKKVAA